ncbi:Rieske (2Fe-2S) protein [Salipiger sp.]|uniref:Rieske (2Fe-2S) protein n=1 Tax=Salipiger sp. TaxID=2078585 RepID=UPI003A97C9CE
MSWQDLSSAPDPGTRVCARAELRGARALVVTTERGAFPMLVVETPAGVRGYVNACPHQYLPLDHRGPQILSADGRRLMCSNHGAMFDIETGAGEGCALDPVPLRVDGSGAVVIGLA